MTDQAVQPSGPAVPPARGGGAASPRFVGRVRELAALHADLERAGLHTLSGRPAPHARVLLIAGGPGTGRTELAEEFVGQVTKRDPGRYPGGVLRARLTGPGGAPVPTERTARDLLAALGHDPVPPGADEEEVAEAVRTALAERRALLLLDDVARPGQLLDLLPGSRDCAVVAVSSGPLTGVPDVRPCTLGGLERRSAVALFARHARAPHREHRVTVDPRSAELVAEACGDLPAALALAGGWLGMRPMLSVADGARQLAAVPGRTPLERAYRLVRDSLAPSPARTLRMLTLAPGGLADPHIASALAGCTVAAARQLLEEFLRLGLVRAARTAPGCYAVPACLEPLLRAEVAERERPDEVMLARARMLERLVRQLRVCQAVTEPEGSAARRRLAELPPTLRFAGPRAARDWLESRRPVLLAAARLAVEEGGGELDTLARRLVSALARAGDAHHPAAARTEPERYRLHELVLRVAERGGLHRERAAALLNLGDLDSRTGRHTRALTRYRGALDAARALGDPAATGRALEALGAEYEQLADPTRAADWYGRALALHQAGQNPAARAAAARLHGRLGTVHARAGRHPEALREWKAAAAAFRRLPDPAAHARALGEAARAQEAAGRAREALRTGRQAVEAARRTGEAELRAALLEQLAGLCERAGEAAEGRVHRTAAGELRRAAGLPPEEQAPPARGPADAGGDTGAEAAADVPRPAPRGPEPPVPDAAPAPPVPDAAPAPPAARAAEPSPPEPGSRAAAGTGAERGRS